MTGKRPRAAADDRIYPVTRVALGLIVLILVAAFLILYLRPSETDTLFAWTIKPSMTAILMGAGYLGGAYVFAYAVAVPRWHRIGLTLLPVTVFTWYEALATVLHWERFHQGHSAFWTWVVVYGLTPLVVPALWLYNRRADPGAPEPYDAVVPAAMRTVIGLLGAAQLAISLVLFLWPEGAIRVWPWALTPLTARVLAGWFALPGVFGRLASRERRWSALRIPVQGQALAQLLILIGVARAWGDFNPANPLTELYVGGVVVWLAAVATLYITMELRVRRQRRMAPRGAA